MKFWNDYPLIRILLPLILGILLAYYYPSSILPIWTLFILVGLSSFWAFRPSFLRKYTLRFFGGIMISFLFILIGNQLIEVNTERFNQHHYSKQDSISHLIVSVNSPLTEKKNSYKATGLVIGGYIDNDSIPIKLLGKILLYFEKTHSIQIEYGDEIIIQSQSLEEVKNLGNPNEFDFASYLKRQNIQHHVFLRNTDWLKTNHQSPNFFKKWSLKLRNQLLSILKDLRFNEPEFAVASALLLGYDEYLDPDLRQKYAGSGAMHILCVSGLHVGIIFMIFNVLFAPIRKIKYGAYISSFCILIVIWIYAMVTGMSPSVFRSATMFSFIAVGGILKRKTSTYNSLAASAVVLLISDPYLIFQIGFQLSYAAVLSILILQPPLSKLVKCKNWLSIKIRDLVAVSIAAQLGTFPLAIYYFHQFPNYFILTNLIVIPLSFLILISGFSALFIHSISIIKSILGFLSKQILYWFLFGLNFSINFINQLPFSVSTNLYFTFWDTAIIYLLIIFLSFSFINKKAKLLIYFFILAIALMLGNSFVRYQTLNSQQLIIYHIPKSSALEISSSRKSIIYMDTALVRTKNYERYTNENWLMRRIEKADIFPFDSIKSKHILFNGSELFILDNDLLIPKDTYHFDYLYLRNNPKIKLFDLQKRITFDTVIMDGSNKYWNLNNWMIECDSLHIPYHHTKEKGAFIIENSF